MKRQTDSHNMRICMYVYTHMYAYLHTHVYMYMYIHICRLEWLTISFLRYVWGL